MDNIDLWFYINLERRPDRKQEILAEFKRMEIPDSKIIRIDATDYKLKPAWGCSDSHNRGLEMVLKINDERKQKCESLLKHVAMLEDDFNFKWSKEGVNHILSNAFAKHGHDYKVIMLAANIRKTEPCDETVDYVRHAQSTAGYVINVDFIPNLLSLWVPAADALKRTHLCCYYCNDLIWIQLQRQNWFVTKPKVGYQRRSYSDIGNAMHDYGC